MGDLVNMEHVNEAAVLDVLRARFALSCFNTAAVGNREVGSVEQQIWDGSLSALANLHFNNYNNDQLCKRTSEAICETYNTCSSIQISYL